MSDPRLIIGAMSGTSADGVDGALVKIEGKGLSMSARCLAHHHHPYAPAVREAIFALRQSGRVSLADLACLGRDISMACAVAAKQVMREANVRVEDLAALAAHGQTLYHDPPNTIQWLDPALLAAEVGCAVVSDFRRADCAAGGQGAPLVPFADFILFGNPKLNRILLNLGGIANLTFLRAGGGLEQIIAFDTGPANCISDALCRRARPDGPGYDESGKLSRAGRVNKNLVDAFVDADYFHQPPPKSTDTPATLAIWDKHRPRWDKMTLEDELATACCITASSIGQAVRDFLPHAPAELLVSGGGSQNSTMLAMIQEQLHPMPIRQLDELGVNSQSKEAVAFALLGAATLDNTPANVPSATGAARPVVLGSITPRP